MFFTLEVGIRFRVGYLDYTMRNLLRTLWHDDAGAVISTELTMVLGIVVAGMGSGLAVLRNNVNRQLMAVSALPDAVIPTPADLQRQVAVQPVAPFVAKSQSTATSVSNSHSASNVNVYVNVQYPTRNDIPSP